jgi:cytochrome c oxidase accessory protein FixG
MATSPEENLYRYEEEYRDTIATVDASGKRIWVYPKKPSGRYHTWRIVVAIVLLVLLFGAPLLKVNGQPFMLFNIFERKFIIFGQAFWPQDFFLFALFAISLVVFIILFTVLFGRIWCGWACPQTIFMEMVFRKIEYWIEGDANNQRKLNAAPISFSKLWKKGLKHFIFIAISLLISHTLMAYLIGVDQVKDIISQPPANHMAGFIGLMAFTGVFYSVFAWFREQACIAVCPYGRLQGVLLDKNSMVIIYDWLRGEPRGKIKKNKIELEQQGDCIDCKLCVHACPTGIDIRNGTQLECVNCTACIDACDAVMDKIDKPRGLIRFDTYAGVESKQKFGFTTRTWAYSVVLGILALVLITLLITRSDVESTILRVPGQLYQQTESGAISNLYNAQFVNKSAKDMVLEIRIFDEPDGKVTLVGREMIELAAGSYAESVFFVEMPRSKVSQTKTSIVLEIRRDGETIDRIKTNFLGPSK